MNITGREIAWTRRAFLGGVTGALCAGAAPKQHIPFTNPLFAMDTCTKRSYPRADLTPEQQLELIGRNGFAGYAWTADEPVAVRAVLATGRQRGLRMFAIYFGTQLGRDGLNCDTRLASVLNLLAEQDTLLWLHISSQDFPRSSPAGDAVAVAALRKLADQAQDQHVRVALYPHVGSWLERVQDAVRVARSVARPNLGVTFNLCHCLKVGDEARIPELLADAAPHLFAVTINGADSHAANAGWDRLIRPVGEGSLDLAPLLRNLHSLRYVGPIGVQGYGIKLAPDQQLERSMRGWRKLLDRAFTL